MDSDHEDTLMKKMDNDHEDTLMKKKPMHLPKQQGTLCMTMKGNCCTCKPLTHVDCQVQTKEHDLSSVHILTACLVTSKTLQHWGDGGRGEVGVMERNMT